MSTSLTPEPKSGFVCDCEEWMRSACGEPFYKDHEGKRYCVLHFPIKDKSLDFNAALKRKLNNKDFNLRGVWFPDKLSFRDFVFGAEADFRSATFSAEADFRSATFSENADFGGATFSENADFGSATFSENADFGSATFSENADFGSATFITNVNFSFATFRAEADFGAATFGGEADFGAADFFKNAKFEFAAFRKEAYFRKATFGAEANFSRVTFDDYVGFAGEQDRRPFLGGSSLDLQFTRIEKPDHVSFHMLTLRPHWLVNVDARKFDFVNVEWRTQLPRRHPLFCTLNEEIKALIEREVETPHRLQAIACWQLADNAEENHRYEEASKFRYTAMDARRREHWHGFAFWRLSWWYWLASGYGERVLQAFVILVGIWLLAGLFYTRGGFSRWEPRLASEADAVVALKDDVGAPLKFSRALTYSAAVMTFQRPEPKPATTAAQTVVLFETILGPVQAALLALAIRRKFMR